MITQAVVFTAPGEVIVDELDLPALSPNDALVEIEYSAISIGTERWCLQGAIQVADGRLIEFPCVPGYQAAGTVRDVGPEVQTVAPGDRVFSINGRITPGTVGSTWGGHQHYHVADAGGLIPLPANVSTREAAGLVLAQVGYNGASRPRVQPGDVAVVIGDGLVGQWAGQVLRHRGAHVILAGHHRDRLALAARYAADEVLDTHAVDLREYVRERYPRGIPLTVETASKRELIRLAVELLQYDAQFVLLGYYPEGECVIDTHWVRARETTVYCPNGIMRPRMESTLGLISQGHMHVEELITHQFPYQMAPQAYRLLLDRSTDFLGIVIDWTGQPA